MEKKSIGKFISALRRANGMTQKDLGERLFVSDKTVSRWECDECTPDLSLIPLIAETFGITTDELLRGEKNNTEKIYADPEGAALRQKEKSDKQLKLILNNKRKSFRNLKLIAIGISILGLIVGMLCNFAFLRGDIGFWLSMALITAGEICLICFAGNSKIFIDEDDEEEYNEKIRQINYSITEGAITGTTINATFFAFCLPFILAPFGAGIQFGIWAIGMIFSSIITWIIYIILYNSVVRKNLVAKDLLPKTNSTGLSVMGKKLLITSLIILGIDIVIGLIAAFLYYVIVQSHVITDTLLFLWAVSGIALPIAYSIIIIKNIK